MTTLSPSAAPDRSPETVDRIIARARHDRSVWLHARLGEAMAWLRGRLTNRLPLNAREA